RDLIEKIRHLGAKRNRVDVLAASAGSPASTPDARLPLARLQTTAIKPPPSLRPFGHSAPRVLLIGSSTGGPQALMTLIAGLGPVIDRFPVLITQHMPATFTTILAEHLARASGRPALEAVEGEIIRCGRIYLAPGGRHMRVTRRGTDAAIALDDGMPVNFCK